MGKTVYIELRRRIKTEEKAKVIAAVRGGGGEFIKFLVAQSILYQDDLMNRMKCTRKI